MGLEELGTGRAPGSAGRRGCFTSLTEQLSKTEQHKYLCVKKKIKHAFSWRIGGICFIMLCLEMFVNTASSCHTTAKIRIQHFKACVEASFFLMRYLRTTHTPKSMVWVCESAHVFTLNRPQLREVREMHNFLKVSFQPGTHKCHLTREHKFLPLLFMWLMPQTRLSSWPHTDIKAFKQELG